MHKRWIRVLTVLLLSLMLNACQAVTRSEETPRVSGLALPSTATATSRFAGASAAAPPTAVTATMPAAVLVYTYRVVNSYPHDPQAFTQGLAIADGQFYEGTGLNGKSSLRRVDLETGKVLQRYDLDPAYFGEGITIVGERILQLTWQSNVGFVYDRESFEPQQQWTYQTEGWGLTHDGTHLIMSDGTATLRLLDPTTFAEIGRVDVFDNNGPVARLNELEYINGEIWANVWQTDRIARIDPQVGRVVGWIDLSGLLSQEDKREPVDVLNGIAYDPINNRLFVTGKLWPKLFEIEVFPQQ